MITVDMVREIARDLPRSYEVVVHDRIKFRVGKIVWLAFSRDEQIMGFAFPKEERAALVASEPHTFRLPGTSDLRFNWIEAHLDALDAEELREVVIEAWCMVVPKKVSAEYLRSESPLVSRLNSPTPAPIRRQTTYGSAVAEDADKVRVGRLESVGGHPAVNSVNLEDGPGRLPPPMKHSPPTSDLSSAPSV